MIVVGLALAVVGLLLSLPYITTGGVVLALVGAALLVLGVAGQRVGPRMHYW